MSDRMNELEESFDQREAFEQWAVTQDLSTRTRIGYEYGSCQTRIAWEAWQAAIEHAKKTMCNRN